MTGSSRYAGRRGTSTARTRLTAPVLLPAHGWEVIDQGATCPLPARPQDGTSQPRPLTAHQAPHRRPCHPQDADGRRQIRPGLTGRDWQGWGCRQPPCKVRKCGCAPRTRYRSIHVTPTLPGRLRYHCVIGCADHGQNPAAVRVRRVCQVREKGLGRTKTRPRPCAHEEQESAGLRADRLTNFANETLRDGPRGSRTSWSRATPRCMFPSRPAQLRNLIPAVAYSASSGTGV